MSMNKSPDVRIGVDRQTMACPGCARQAPYDLLGLRPVQVELRSSHSEDD